ncbi:MAG: type III pantothenate kinase [Planctomycetota bacterium]
MAPDPVAPPASESLDSQQPILLMDIGNSAIKLARIENPAITRRHLDNALASAGDWFDDGCKNRLSFAERDTCVAIATGTSRWPALVAEQLCDWVDSEPATNRTDSPKIDLRIASVREDTRLRLCNEVLCRFPMISAKPVQRRDLPIRLQIENPDSVGIDRLLAVIAAKRIFRGPAVVVDAGSAVTIDWLYDNSFCGGAILAGLALQIETLSRGTSALPSIQITDAFDQPVGRNTRDAIRLGVLGGISAVIAGLHHRYVSAADRPSSDVASVPTPGEVPILLTGGDGPLLGSQLRCDASYLRVLTAENAVLMGML